MQPLSRMVAASATYGCSLCHIWLQARLNAEKNKNDPPGKMDEDILRKRKEMAEERKRKT